MVKRSGDAAAIFKAIQERQQSGILVANTIFGAQQHTKRFKQRFIEFPVEIGLLSRFKNKKTGKS